METMQYTVETIDPDETGLEFFLTRYKPFRLNALQTDPVCFGSNYAREAAFEDEEWRDRLRKPGVRTFVAVRPDTRDILSSVSMIRREPPPEVVAALGTVIGAAGEGTGQQPPVHFSVNAVYTRPDARRKGIAHAIMAPAIQYSLDVAASEGRPCLLTVVAYKHNPKAILLYQKVGFLVGPAAKDETEVLLSLYRPFNPRVVTV